MTVTYKYFSFDEAGQFDMGELLCIQSDDGKHEPLPVSLPDEGEVVSIPLIDKDKSFSLGVTGVVKSRGKVSGVTSDVVWHIDVAIGMKQ